MNAGRRDEPVVLHVVPTAVARGAQREARALADHLDRPGERRHMLMSLFAGPADVPIDESLEHPGRPGAVAEGLDPHLVLRLRRRLWELDPAVVVAHGGDPLKYLVPALVGRRRPLAYYATGTFGASARPRVALWRMLVHRADVVACEGEEVLAECAGLLGVRPDRLVLAPNGRDPEVFRPRTPHESEVGAPLLAFVGALNSGKGPDRFVKVVGELRRQQVALRAAMVGGGPLHGELAAPAAEAGIEMLGTLEDVAPVLRRADVMLFPSRPTGEGMPGVLIEAGLSGLPVVASRVPGVAMIVDDGVTGLVVDGGDTDAMVQATARLLTDEALRQRMGAAARVRCAERFSLDAVVSIWWSFLEPLFERGLSRRRARNGPGSRPGPVA